MSDQVKRSMMQCRELEPAEQEKVERLDGQIWEKLRRAGLNVRVCEGKGTGEFRLLYFWGHDVVATIRASDFLSASDDDAVAMIEIVSPALKPSP